MKNNAQAKGKRGKVLLMKRKLIMLIMPKVMAIKTMLKCAKKCNDDCGQIVGVDPILTNTCCSVSHTGECTTPGLSLVCKHTSDCRESGNFPVPFLRAYMVPVGSAAVAMASVAGCSQLNFSLQPYYLDTGRATD